MTSWFAFDLDETINQRKEWLVRKVYLLLYYTLPILILFLFFICILVYIKKRIPFFNFVSRYGVFYIIFFLFLYYSNSIYSNSILTKYINIKFLIYEKLIFIEK